MASSGTVPCFCASCLSVVRKDIWAPVLNEVHPIQQEHGNPEDRYAACAVSILKDDLL